MAFEEAGAGVAGAPVAPLAATDIQREQVRLLYANLPPGLVVTAVNAAILALMEWHVVPQTRIAAWLLAVLLVAVARYRLVGYYRSAPQAHDTNAWGRYYAIATAAAGLVWGAAAVWLFPQALLPQVFLFFMLTAMTVGAVVSFSAIFSVALIFVVFVLGPLALRFFVSGGRIHEAMAVVAVAFMGVMLLTARRVERTVAASLQLRFENRGLIAHLEAEKAAAHRLNEDLRREVVLHSRTAGDLKERESYIRAVLEHVEEGIVTVNRAGCLRSLNREALRIFGYKEEEIIGSHFSQLVPAAERAEYTRFLESQMERVGVKFAGHGLEVNGLRRDGTIFPMELGLSAMTAGSERGFVAVTRDVTNRRRSERLKGELVAALGHEIRTPLTSALGSLGLLTETATTKLAVDDMRLLRIARSNMERLARTVAELLDVDNNHAATMKWTLAPLILTRLAEEAVTADADYAQARNIRLALDPCSSAAVIQGDRGLLLRALSHLLINAIHLAPPHTTVEVAITTEMGVGVVSVRDCGAALPLEARARLFDPQPGAPVRDLAAPRSLWVARTIAEKHGGTVGYEAREAGGSHFFLRVPLFAATSAGRA